MTREDRATYLLAGAGLVGTFIGGKAVVDSYLSGPAPKVELVPFSRDVQAWIGLAVALGLLASLVPAAWRGAQQW